MLCCVACGTERAAQQRTVIPEKERTQTETNIDGAQPKYRITLAPYSTFLNKEGFLDFTNISLSKINAILGEAPVSLRIGRPGAPVIREIRVYFPYEEDPTGLFLFFRNETLVSFRMDEFNGITSPLIQDFFNQ
jgi:hypothetical protein